jgi:hypothetical protein
MKLVRSNLIVGKEIIFVFSILVAETKFKHC